MVAHAKNPFALRLFDHLAARPGNFIVAPASLDHVLTMGLAGARGPTAAAFRTTLGGPTGRVRTRVKASLPGFVMRRGDAVWVDRQAPLNPVFARAVAKAGGSARMVDFRARSVARRQINDWVAKVTDQQIRSLIAPGALAPTTRLVLTDAVYFHAAWAQGFDRTLTKAGRFKVEGGPTVKVAMMHRTGRFDLVTAPGVRMIELPYAGPAEMDIILPDHPGALSMLAAHLTGGQLAHWFSRARTTEVTLSLPRFSTETSQSLRASLTAMGMGIAFGPRADFAGMLRSNHPLFISDVIQQAKITVNERGTKAEAASNGTVAVALSASAPLPTARFDVDHSFIYLIRSEQTGAIWFIGRVTDPVS